MTLDESNYSILTSQSDDEDASKVQIINGHWFQKSNDPVHGLQTEQDIIMEN